MGLKVKLRAANLSLAVALAISVPTVVAPMRCIAQTTTASLSGTVTDPSGAVVPKAKAVLTNTTTGATQSTVSNKDGLFTFSSVESGDYTVTITAKGFSTYSETGVHLDPQDRRVLHNLQLAVGSVGDVVTVVAEETGIPTDTGEVSSLISAEEIKHLAIEGRDVTELLKILPGFTPVTTAVNNAVYDPSQVGVSGAVGQYSGNGTPLYAVALLSDGADITDPGNFGATIQTVNYDQVSEVKVQTASMTADSAHGPIIVNALGAYGGNHFHGSLYTYARTNQLNTQDWYSKATGQAKPDDRQIYPGFTFGGPILIPGTRFNEARKLNFWVGAEQYAQRNVYAYGSAGAATAVALVPTAAMKTGDFSQTQLSTYLGGFYAAPKIVNGYQQQQCYANYVNICEVPQTDENGNAVSNGNISATLDPGAKVLLNMLPNPTPGIVPTPPTATSPGTPYNWIQTNLTNNDLWQARGRLDFAPGEKTKAFGVYSTETGLTTVPQIPYYSPTSVMGATNTPGGMVDRIHVQLAAVNVVTILSNTLTNEFYGSGSYFKENWKNKTLGDYKTTVGYPYQGLFANGSQVVPQLNDYGYDGLPIDLYQDYGLNGLGITKFVRTAGDNVTKQIRTHTVRVGAFFQMDSNNQPGGFYQPTNGEISQYYLPETFTTVNGQLVHDTGQVGSGNGGNYLADFAEGNVFQFEQQNTSPGANLWFLNLAGYAQDHWRLLQNLSVDYGLRIEHITPWSDAHGVGVPVWNASAYYSDNSGSPLPGFLWHDIDHSIPMSGYSTRWGYIEPRVGFSYDPLKKGKTIVRGGFGIYRAHDSYNDAASGENDAYGVRQLVQQETTLATVNTARAPINSGSANEAALIASGNGTALYGVQAGDDEMPQVKTWDFAVVQALPEKMQVQFAYVGSYSNFMLDDGVQGNVGSLDNINALPVGAIYATGQYTTSNYTQVSQLQPAQVNAFRPYPTYGDLQVARHRLYSNYNGLQTSLLKQSGRIRFNVNYTFSKALGVLGGFNNGQPINPFNLRDQYLPEGFDRTHVFNASYTYIEGKAFHFPSRILSSLANNWEVSGITNLLSGPNMQSIQPNFGLNGTIMGAPNPTIGNLTAQYTLALSPQVFLGTPDVRLQPQVLCDPATSGNHHYFKNACFSLPTAVGTNGTYRFPYIHGPAYVDSDLTLTRNFDLPHGQSFHLRVAAFNFLNRANPSFNPNEPANYTLGYSEDNNNITNPAAPATLASDPNANALVFGRTDLKQGRRILEISLKYNF